MKAYIFAGGKVDVGAIVTPPTDDDLCMHFNSNVSPCVVKPEEGDQYLYLILPVRVFS